MINKKIKNPRSKSSKSVRITSLVSYITNPTAKHELSGAVGFHQHKCTHIGMRNFITIDIKNATTEMIALASESVRSTDPVAHYMLSWKKGEHPTPAQIDRAVEIMMEELGYKDMQAIYGLHMDTDNDHLHSIVNMVDPLTGKVRYANKGFDIECLHRAVARIEREQGWEPEVNARYKILENGDLVNMHPRSQDTNEPKSKVKDIEVLTGEKSVLRQAIEDVSPILKNAKNWADLHSQMETAGFRFEKVGNGGKIFIGAIGVKASDVSRQYGGFSKLEKRLGVFQAGSYALGYTKPSEPLPAAKTVPGSGDYYKAKRLFYEAKEAIQTKLNSQVEVEKKELLDKHSVIRTELVLQHKWVSNGEARNAMEALVAAQKKAELDALKRQQVARAMHQLKAYKSFPPMESWLREHVGDDAAEAYRSKDSKQPEAPAAIGSFEEPKVYHKRDILTFTYLQSDAGLEFYRQGFRKAAFIDQGKTISIHDHGKDSLLAAMQLAIQKWPNGIELNGSDEFKRKAVDIAIANNIKISNADLQDYISLKSIKVKSDEIMLSEQSKLFLRYHDAVKADRYRVTAIKRFPDNRKMTFVLDKKDKDTTSIGWTPDEVIQHERELLSLHARQEDIHYTPLSANLHHILIDDLHQNHPVKGNSLKRLIDDGYKPATLMKTSNDNYQAIITIPKNGNDFDNAIGNKISGILNKEYGDEKLSGAIHPHRAPGYSNFKPAHKRENGSYPAIELLKSEQRQCQKCIDLANKIHDELIAEAAAKVQRQRIAATTAKSLPGTAVASTSAMHSYNVHRDAILKMQHRSDDGVIDMSRIDGMTVIRMRMTGHSQIDIESVLGIVASDKHQGTDYAARTAKFAFSSEADRQIDSLRRYEDQWRIAEGQPSPILLREAAAKAKAEELRKAKVAQMLEEARKKPRSPDPIKRDQWGNVVRKESQLIRNSDGCNNDLSM